MELFGKYIVPLLSAVLGVFFGFLGALYLQKRQHAREDEQKTEERQARREAVRRRTRLNDIQRDILGLCSGIGDARFEAVFTDGIARINGQPVKDAEGAVYVGGLVQTQLVQLDAKGLIEILDEGECDLIFEVTDLARGQGCDDL